MDDFTWVVQHYFKKRGWKLKKLTNTHLAISTSVFILLSVIYSLIVAAPMYKFILFLHSATMMVSIITLGIHFNALKENKEKKKLILFSLVVPITTLIYFIVGIIYMLIRGTPGQFSWPKLFKKIKFQKGEH